MQLKIKFRDTLGHSYNEQFSAQKCARSSLVFIVTERFNIVVNEGHWLYCKLFACSRRVLVIIENENLFSGSI